MKGAILLRWLGTLGLLTLVLRTLAQGATPPLLEVEVSVDWEIPTVAARLASAASHRIYLPIVMDEADIWPIPRATPTPRVVLVGGGLESIGFAHYYSADGQRWNFYTDVTLSPIYPWALSELTMLYFRGTSVDGELLYENRDHHLADPPWVHPGGTTRIEWDVPAADVPRGIWGISFLLRGRS